jgi:HD-GYP domain-containing protein (c-di-GMP phosphodiesterase class II)
MGMSQDKPQVVSLQSVSDLIAPGEPLPFRVLDSFGRLLLAEGQRVHDLAQLKSLLERGASVVQVEADAVRQARQPGQSAANSRAPSGRHLTWFDRWERHLWEIDDALREASKGSAQAAQITAMVDQQWMLVAAQPDAALFTIQRQDERRFALYALTHARDAATVVQLTASGMGWPEAQVRSVVAAALTMNAPTVELQARMAEQSDPPSKKQLEQLREHPMRAAAMMRASGIADAAWLEAVEQHHEQAGGGGYPAGLQSPCEMARLLRAADVYTAKISPRAIRAPLASQVAARHLFQEEKGSPMAGALIKAVGVYPPGDIVKLANGEVAIVTHRAQDGKGTQAAVLLGANGKPAGGSTRRDTADKAFVVTGIHAERAALARVLPEQVYGLLYAEGG